MITSMYGHCDAFDVIYTQIGENQWQATVPPDLTDGKYVVDIYGVDNTGFLVYWAGILYRAGIHVGRRIVGVAGNGRHASSIWGL